MSQGLVNLENSVDFVLSSSYRWRTLAELSRGCESARQISERIGVYSSHISRTLEELSEEGLVECTTPEKERGRLYTLTDEGSTIAGRVRILAGVPSLEYRIANTLDDIPVPYAKNVGGSPKDYEKIAEFVVLNAEFEPQAAICGLNLSGDMSECLGALLLWINRWIEEKKEIDIVLVVRGNKQNVLEGESSLSSGGLFDAVLHEKDLTPSKLSEYLEVDQSDYNYFKGGEKSG